MIDMIHMYIYSIYQYLMAMLKQKNVSDFEQWGQDSTRTSICLKGIDWTHVILVIDCILVGCLLFCSESAVEFEVR